MDQDVDTPSYFLCPISLHIMKDPVTLPTGITYDREAIERWIYSSPGHVVCPATKQPLSPDTADLLTPNHTLRRLIQSWCTINAVERFPTPKPPVTRPHVAKLISRARHGPVAPVLRQLKSLALESAANRRVLEAAGAVPFLCSVISGDANALQEEEVNATVDLALSVLLHLNVSDPDLVGVQSDVVLGSLTRVIHCSGSYETRKFVVQLMSRVLETAHPNQLVRFSTELFTGLVQIIQDQESCITTTKGALRIMIQVSQWGRNRVKAVEAGAVGAAVEILLDGAAERRVTELAVVVVDRMCGCAEGRAALVAHGGGMAALTKRTLRVSVVATERAVRAMWAVAKHSATERVVREMAEVGAVEKLWWVVQAAECEGRVKEMANEILRMHGAAWKGSPCVPAHLLRSYRAK